MRVFAGPNGSGKSTIIRAVRSYKVKGIPVDFGIYVNADDIARGLRKGKFSLRRYRIKFSESEFINVVSDSGLLNDGFDYNEFMSSFKIEDDHIILLKQQADERLAQIIADFLRKKLLLERRKFSFETVFSHQSKLDIMKEAVNAGYKVYLYFVSTESPEINKYRVKKVRVEEGGHDVPEEKIVSRYYRSLDFLHEAAQLSYQTFFFDNSRDGEGFRMFAHFKMVGGVKKWDEIEKSIVPRWFITYYSKKIFK